MDFGQGHKIGVFSAKDVEDADALNKSLEATQVKEESLQVLQNAVNAMLERERFDPSQKMPFSGGYTLDMLKKAWGSMGAGRQVRAPESRDQNVQAQAWEKTLGLEKLVMYPRGSCGSYREDNFDPGWTKYHNIRDLLARFFLRVHLTHGKISNWRKYCIGITSMVASGPEGPLQTVHHVPMFDYDGKNIKTRVKKDAKNLQKKYNLGDATIFSTHSGLHVYFFSDIVPPNTFRSMLEEVGCCQGFKTATQRKGFAVLRVSAKYTEFDIHPYKTVVSPNRGANRPGRKAALVRALLQLGQNCGTHFASMYPQWAYFEEDLRPWKPQKRGSGKRIRKVSAKENGQVVAKKKVTPRFYSMEWGQSGSQTVSTSEAQNQTWYVSNYNK